MESRIDECYSGIGFGEYRWDNGKMDNPEKLITYRVHKRWKQKHNTICDGRHYAQANTNNVNKT
jgi:hypothetical protein